MLALRLNENRIVGNIQGAEVVDGEDRQSDDHLAIHPVRRAAYVKPTEGFPWAWNQSIMQDELASLVYPILSNGLRLKDRLDRGDDLELEREQGHLKGMLLTDTEARRWVDFGGDAEPASLGNGGGVGMEGLPRASEAFLGIRFALVCW